ncbi:molybdate ABC transporter substrate-binding protein [Lysobacter sp. TY2-98]|uniref:molybdate ABC transporter substrate-binding protein n=1 Tax=Lysobacter sp. TY2-98 TaxID=2290922 RepID=UPI000E201A12|nr:molybdate ABC transporter substrate-binding protein [Lysobacter sp. TY2-98]AXK72398.1 molybdate ABC transporter substrate-binding protein [Lysobacter sp. TY2-98]
MRPPHRVLVALLSLLVSLPAFAASPITVFAAASLKETLDEAGALYQRDHGAPVRAPVRASYAASSALARQIEDGAPADVFVSADRDWMDALQAKHLIDAKTRRDVAGNALVLVAPIKAKTPTIVLKQGVDLRPALGADGRLALALTASVPAGKYGRAALASLGAWSDVRSRVVEAENVRAALQLVARGEAVLGIVYASDAQAEPRVRVVARFPPSTHPRIVYPAARVAASTNPQAAALVAWLCSPAGQAVFRKHGFLPPK